jgi:hypothetical protein
VCWFNQPSRNITQWPNKNIVITGCSSENAMHMHVTWTDHFLHKPRQKIDNEDYYISIEFPNLLIIL